MRGFDYTAGTGFDGQMPKRSSDSRFALICNTDEAHSMANALGWHERTLRECENLDESVRHLSLSGYDFVSLVYAEPDEGAVAQSEINLFYSRDYLALIVPTKPGRKLLGLIKSIEGQFEDARSRKNPLSYLYFCILDSFAADYSETLERLEDEMEDLSEAIERRHQKNQSAEISRLRKSAYTYKKLLRALSYIGTQILVDENDLLGRDQVRYFRNIDTRLIKLYDFAENLYDLSSELLHSYDSKSAAKMNETVNKLTIITLFFGPLTVIAGIYGMNFANMPELKWPFGYAYSLGLMALVSAIIFIVLKWRKWM